MESMKRKDAVNFDRCLTSKRLKTDELFSSGDDCDEYRLELDRAIEFILQNTPPQEEEEKALEIGCDVVSPGEDVRQKEAVVVLSPLHEEDLRKWCPKTDTEIQLEEFIESAADDLLQTIDEGELMTFGKGKGGKNIDILRKLYDEACASDSSSSEQEDEEEMQAPRKRLPVAQKVPKPVEELELIMRRNREESMDDDSSSCNSSSSDDEGDSEVEVTSKKQFWRNGRSSIQAERKELRAKRMVKNPSEFHEHKKEMLKNAVAHLKLNYLSSNHAVVPGAYDEKTDTFVAKKARTGQKIEVVCAATQLVKMHEKVKECLTRYAKQLYKQTRAKQQKKGKRKEGAKRLSNQQVFTKTFVDVPFYDLDEPVLQKIPGAFKPMTKTSLDDAFRNMTRGEDFSRTLDRRCGILWGQSLSSAAQMMSIVETCMKQDNHVVGQYLYYYSLPALSIVNDQDLTYKKNKQWEAKSDAACSRIQFVLLVIAQFWKLFIHSFVSFILLNKAWTVSRQDIENFCMHLTTCKNGFCFRFNDIEPEDDPETKLLPTAVAMNKVVTWFAWKTGKWSETPEDLAAFARLAVRELPLDFIVIHTSQLCWASRDFQTFCKLLTFEILKQAADLFMDKDCWFWQKDVCDFSDHDAKQFCKNASMKVWMVSAFMQIKDTFNVNEPFPVNSNRTGTNGEYDFDIEL